VQIDPSLLAPIGTFAVGALAAVALIAAVSFLRLGKSRARAAGDSMGRSLAEALGWPRARDAWGSVGAMLFCLLTGLSVVGFLVYKDAAASFGVFGFLGPEPIRFITWLVTMSAVAAAALPLYLPSFASAVRGTVLGLMVGLIAGIATSPVDRASEYALGLIGLCAAAIVVGCVLSSLTAWIVGAVLSRLARHSVSRARDLPKYVVIAGALMFGIFAFWSQISSQVLSRSRTDPDYRLVPSIWRGHIIFGQTVPFTLSIERVEPDGQFTGFMDYWENYIRLGIEGKATGNHLVFVGTRILRGKAYVDLGERKANVNVGERKAIWISGAKMTGTDKDGKAMLVAQLLTADPAEVAAVLAPAAGQVEPPAVRDVPSENIAALVTTATLVPAEPDRAPRAAVDQRWWIDVWELRRDVAQVERMPPPNEHCWPEGDPDEPQDTEKTPEQLKQARDQEVVSKACEAESERAAATLERARRALNEAWLPALKEAMKKGDPVAEVILRTCVTTGVLDRSGIETDCSQEPVQKEIARRRLESIGFVPALGELNREDLQAMVSAGRRTPARPWTGQGPHSDVPSIAMHERMIATMERGDLGASRTYLPVACPSYWKDRKGPYDDDIFLRCNYLHHMSQAMAREARWFFTAGGYPLPFALRLSLTPQSGTPIDLRNAEPPRPLENLLIKNPAGFRAELGKRLSLVDANIASYLRQDPRWAVFLMERSDGMVRFAVRPASAPTDRRINPATKSEGSAGALQSGA